MAQEIERKFLVQGEFKSKAFAKHCIFQGYICSMPGHTVRIRRCDNKAYITIKGPSTNDGLSRFEWEKEIDVAEAVQLLDLCEPGLIEKTRYLVKYDNHIFEVDEFYGDNKGLVIAEVELGSVDEKCMIPDFVGQEVTGDRRYYNTSLMKKPYKTWQK